MPVLMQMPNWNWGNVIHDFHTVLGLKNFKRWWNDQAVAPVPVPGEAPGGAPAGLPPELMAVLGGQGGQPQAGGLPGAASPGGAEGDGLLTALAGLGRATG